MTLTTIRNYTTSRDLTVSFAGLDERIVGRNARPPHLVGLIRPVAVRHSADAEDERSEDGVSEA